MSIVEDLMALNEKTCRTLWKMRTVGDGQHNTGDNVPRIVFPRYRSGNARHSEQEARFIFCSHLNSMNYYYSVETPTEREYQFTGEGSRSAMSDASLYNAQLKLVANVEFKSKCCVVESIRKDLEKLIREKIAGGWFHILTKTDNGTLTRLFEKFVLAFKEVAALPHGIPQHSISIVVCICVLEPRGMRIKHFYWSGGDIDGFNDYVKNFFEDKGWRKIEK